MIRVFLKRFLIFLHGFIAKILVPIMQWLIAKVDGKAEFYELEKFPWYKEIEANAMIIQEELKVILKKKEDIPCFQEVAMDQAYLTQDQNWRTFCFYAYGHKCTENCIKCPKTFEILKKIPELKTALFSILAPGKHIKSHQGPYSGVLRYHLGLIIPKEKEKCRIKVGKTFRFWEEGKSMIFDDSHWHQVWNDTEETRVVLFVDFIRPLPFPVNIINKGMIWFFSLNLMFRDTVKVANTYAKK